MTIDIALAAGPLDLTLPGRRWGQAQWGKSGWDGTTGTLPAGSLSFSVGMAGAAPINRYLLGGDCSMVIDIAMAGAAPTEITLPPPPALRLASWLRPAL